MNWQDQIALIAETLHQPITSGPVAGIFNTPIYTLARVERALYRESLHVLNETYEKTPDFIFDGAYREDVDNQTEGDFQYVPLARRAIGIVSVSFDGRSGTEVSLASLLQRAQIPVARQSIWAPAFGRIYYRSASECRVRYVYGPPMADWQADARILPEEMQSEAVRRATERLMCLEKIFEVQNQ